MAGPGKPPLFDEKQFRQVMQARWPEADNHVITWESFLQCYSRQMRLIHDSLWYTMAPLPIAKKLSSGAIWQWFKDNVPLWGAGAWLFKIVKLADKTGDKIDPQDSSEKLADALADVRQLWERPLAHQAALRLAMSNLQNLLADCVALSVLPQRVVKRGKATHYSDRHPSP